MAGLALFCLTATVMSAQSDPSAPPPTTSPEAQEPTLTIRQTVQRVIVDVMVRDSDGKPVHGLKADDFSIAEDKQPQRVLSFDVYNFDKPSISRAPNAPPLPPHVFENLPATPERGPLYVMLLDLVNTEMADQMMARQQVLKFIRSKPEGTRFAVFVTTDKLRLVQGFTEDKDLLYAAVDPKHPKSHVPKVFLLARNYGYGDPYTAVDMLTHIGQYLDGIPGRKNLIWVAGIFPLAIAAQEGDSAYWASDVRAEMNGLAQAEVAVFPVNVSGVETNPAGTLIGGARSNMQPAANGSSALLNYSAQEEIASVTGGRAFYSVNDLAEILSTATEDGGNYYTLTYSPPNHSDDGKCHNISVKLDKEKYQLSYRRSYCRGILVTTAADENGNHSGAPTLEVPLEAGDVLQANIKPGAPMLHDLLFSAHVRTGGIGLATPAQMELLQEQAAFFRTQRKNKPLRPLPPVKVQTYAIDYRVLDPEFKAQAARTGQQPALEFAVAAFDDDGKVLNATVNDGVPETSTQPAENKAGLYRVHQSLLVPVNAKSLRVGVRDRLNDRMGTLEVQLPLPPESVSKATMPPKPAN
ncbi:MAG TPA: VWA domain-containing protein [Candidatus Sulfotelmatobacter sp.]|nr:VWA domain-containing protein [Candidatus Sulfotelmatobacter sp.]